MKIEVKFQGESLVDLAKRVEKLGETAIRDGVSELNTGGSAMRSGIILTLSSQTGLKTSTIGRFLKETKASVGSPIYELKGSGGNVSLKYFGARETPGGVSAMPWGTRHIFAGTFMKAGWWPNRVQKPNWHGQVFARAGGKTASGMDQFIKVKSGLFIATEMTKGATLNYIETSAERIGASIARNFSSKAVA